MSNRIINAQEVQDHNSEEKGVWIVIDKKVYDVTNFKKHPGQFDILLHNAGTDVSKKFHSIHDAKEVMALAQKFYIGELNEEDKDFQFEVPNQYVQSDVPWYYYLLPGAIFLTCVYLIIFNHQLISVIIFQKIIKIFFQLKINFFI